MNKLTLSDGSLSFARDPSRAFIRVTGTGMWRAELLADHFRQLDREVRVMRNECGRALVLLDIRDAPVQTTEVAATLSDWTARIYRSTDKVAMVCARALLAMQMKRQARIDHVATFGEVDQALAWLLGKEGETTPLTRRA